MKQHFVINIPLYKTYIGVFIDCKHKDVKKWADRYAVEITDKHFEDIADTAGRCIYTDKVFTLLLTRKGRSDAEFMGVIAHEMMHVTAILMEVVNIKLNEHTDEAYAYLMEYLVREATQNLKISKKNARH